MKLKKITGDEIVTISACGSHDSIEYDLSMEGVLKDCLIKFDKDYLDEVNNFSAVLGYDSNNYKKILKDLQRILICFNVSDFNIHFEQDFYNETISLRDHEF